MATIFPLDPEINDEFDGYRWDGVAWKIIGINFTKEYVEENDSRLTNERVPTDNSVSTAKIIDGTILDEDVSASANISQSKINGLTSDLSNKASASALTDHVSSSAGVHGIINSASLVYTNDLDLYLTQASASSLYATISQLSASVSEIQNVLLTKMPYSYASASPTNPVPGETWFDSSASASSAIPYFYDGNTDEFVEYGDKVPSFVEYLVIAGGGGGGADTAGGGGAGGMKTGSGYSVTAGVSYTITIGAGGGGSNSSASRGNSGSTSSFDSITTNGGGGGGSNVDEVKDGLSGGSGGGGGARSTGDGTGGAGTSGEGNDGGLAENPRGGGGGGAGSVGVSGSSTSNGGDGSVSSISGSSVTYAGGGGGGRDTAGGDGGSGGGGAGGISSSRNPDAGTVSTGGGGGGGAPGNQPNGNRFGAQGGSGVVIIRYPNTFREAITTGNPTFNPNANGYKVYTFNDSGTIAW